MAGARTSRNRAGLGAVILVCLAGALINGIAGFDAHSNHPTYLPPALQYLDADFLAGDWWLDSAFHYHLAYFALAVGLSWLGVLEWGLGLLNIVAVAGGLFAVHRIAARFAPDRSLAVLVLAMGLMLCTRSFYSAGDSYVFSASLQPSTVGAMATLWAMACYLEKRLLASGLWLALGGLFHTNFLLANLALFGLVHLFVSFDRRAPLALMRKASLANFVRLLGPSLAVLAAFLPLILSLAGETLPPADAARADWIFFHFAVPVHYLPGNDPGALASLAAWQILGLVWTPFVVPPGTDRRRVWAMQAALIAILWTATALATLVFIPQVSRLFLWRLAPFAVVLAAILFIAGTLRQIGGAGDTEKPASAGPIFAVSLVCVLVAPLAGGGLDAQIVSTRPFSPVIYPLLGLMLLLGLRWFGSGMPPLGSRALSGLALSALVWGALTQPGDPGRSRYNLVHDTPLETSEDELFAFVREKTPHTALFLIPPEFELFRLKAQRPVVVDLKALPMNKAGLLEWYARLGAVAGETRPANPLGVMMGYRTLDSERLLALREAYGIDHAVVHADQEFPANDWREVYANARFKVLAYAGSEPVSGAR